MWLENKYDIIYKAKMGSNSIVILLEDLLEKLLERIFKS